MSTSQSVQVKANTKGTTIKLIYHRIEPLQTYNNIIKCCYIILFFCNIVFFLKRIKLPSCRFEKCLNTDTFVVFKPFHEPKTYKVTSTAFNSPLT